MSTTTAIEISSGEYLPICLESLRLDSVLDFDLYLYKSDKMILYRGANLPFAERNRTSLLGNKVDKLYISAKDQHNYQRYIENNIKDILDDSSIPEPTKAEIIYDSASMLVKEVLSKPTLKENIERSKAMVENTVSFILKGQIAFHHLLGMMSIDYRTYTHSVNVCTLSVGLARFMGIDSQTELDRLGIGALMHDVGKTKVSEKILKKPGPLTKEEMGDIKKHPKWGCDIIKETDIIAQVAYRPIMEHHEREDGSGYPIGLKSDDIHQFSKIVAIADVFDAMTTERVYCHAVESFPALKYMYEKKNLFSRDLLEHFIRLMGPIKE